MDFDIPEDLNMIQTMIRDFVTNQLKPLERSLLGKAADLSDAVASLPAETEAQLIKTVKDLGLWGTGVPEEFGGAGLGILGNCLVEEELAQTIVPFTFGDVTPFLFDCNENQKQDYFLPAFNRQKAAYLALMEPGKETDISSISTTAKKSDGHFVLNGRKVSLSRRGDDYFAMVFAITAPDKKPREGVTCFLVDKGMPEFSVVGGEEQQDWQASVRAPIFLAFNDCKVPAENILGEEGKAFSLGKKWLPQRRIIRAARCVGVAHRILEEATLQAQNWTAFGQPISKRPSIQAALADIASNIHATRLMIYEAACKGDKGEPIQREAAMVKMFATQMLHSVADRAAHVWNGPPVIAGLPMDKLCRSAIGTSAVEYGLDLQRNLVATDILKGLRV